jgi:hypothetical protein
MAFIDELIDGFPEELDSPKVSAEVSNEKPPIHTNDEQTRNDKPSSRDLSEEGKDGPKQKLDINAMIASLPPEAGQLEGGYPLKSDADAHPSSRVQKNPEFRARPEERRFSQMMANPEFHDLLVVDRSLLAKGMVDDKNE